LLFGEVGGIEPGMVLASSALGAGANPRDARKTKGTKGRTTMKTSRFAWMAAWLMAGLLTGLPMSALAANDNIVGSLAIAAASPAPALTTELVGVAIIANPGFEKTVSQSLPPFTVPVVFQQEPAETTLNANLSHINVDTTLILTNTTANVLNLVLTLYDGAGVVLSTTPLSVNAHATVMKRVSDLLP
jgi:hypothetical protein